VSARRWGLGALLAAAAVGAVAGVVFWGGFNTAMEATNSMAFCISCHEMKDNVYQEYVKSPHYRNASGVRAICSDCHVPKEWGPKVWRKVQASNELYHHLRGTIDTPEKFEAKRAELAEHVWATMIANDSHECRNCHSWDAMDHQKQTPRGAEKMQAGQKEGKTCIECHKGVAHALPKRDD
jgi:nitrate/TMAO reductase-like tetraheme cytochrome c subunit